MDLMYSLFSKSGTRTGDEVGNYQYVIQQVTILTITSFFFICSRCDPHRISERFGASSQHINFTRHGPEFVYMYSKIQFYTFVTISGITHIMRCGNII
jgi:hypothetical protein